MDRNLSYEIAVKREESSNCLAMLYGSEEFDELAEMRTEEERYETAQARSVFGGAALLFAASLAVVILLLL